MCHDSARGMVQKEAARLPSAVSRSALVPLLLSACLSETHAEGDLQLFVSFLSFCLVSDMRTMKI